MLEKNNLKRRIIFAKNLREFSPWLCVSGLQVRWKIMVVGRCKKRDHSPHNGQEAEHKLFAH
jgi:hypothetical protein